MTSPRRAKWLLDELPELVRRGVLSSEAAEALRRHYAAAGEPRSWATTLFAVLGAVLVGGGIILLLAHNWHQLSRPARTALSLAPLVAGHLAAGWALTRGRGSAAWREGSGSFLFLAVGAAIALVAQTYHLPGDLASFLLTWMLLGLPVVYLLGASLPVLFYLAGIAGWATAPQAQDQRLAFWLLLALAVPHLAILARGARHPGWERTVAWGLALAAAAAAPAALLESLWLARPAGPFYAVLAAGLFLLGSGEPGRASPWRSAFRGAGVLAAAVTALVLSFEFAWDALRQARAPAVGGPLGSAVATGLLALAAASVLALLALRFRALGAFGRLAGGLPLAVGAAWLLARGGGAVPAMALANLYALALGLAAALDRSRRPRWLAHAGMAILAALVAIRFFDSELSFLWRGLGFVLAGALFLGLNVFLGRRLEGAK